MVFPTISNCYSNLCWWTLVSSNKTLPFLQLVENWILGLAYCHGCLLSWLDSGSFCDSSHVDLSSFRVMFLSE